MPLGIPTVGPAPADEPDSETRVSHAAQQRLSSSSISWVTHRYSCRSVHSLYLHQTPLMAAHFRMYFSAVVTAHTDAPLSLPLPPSASTITGYGMHLPRLRSMFCQPFVLTFSCRILSYCFCSRAFLKASFSAWESWRAWPTCMRCPSLLLGSE